MKLHIYCVRDTAIAQYGNPMFLVARGQAIRSFTDEVNRASDDNQMYKHPDDFELYELGEYDSTEAKFETKTPELVIRGKDIKVREK